MIYHLTFTVFHILMLNNVIKAYSDWDGAIVGIDVFNDDSAYMLKPQEMVQDSTSNKETHSSTSVTLKDLQKRPLSPSPTQFIRLIAVAMASLSLTPLIFRTIFSSQSVTTLTMYR